MIRAGILIFILLGGVLTLMSCNEYQQVLKASGSGGYSAKVKLAERLYKEGDYRRAVVLFEQVYSKHLGDPKGERVLYMYADSEFSIGKSGDYMIAAELFDVFLQYYPGSTKRSDALFMKGKSNFMISPKYSVDQKDTEIALVSLQEFIDAYPDDSRLPEANSMVKKLIDKQEKKAFEIAKHYGNIGYHKSCLIALQLFLVDYPGSVYREEAYFRVLESSVKLAVNSVHNKVQQRIDNAEKNYKTLLKYYPKTQYKEASDATMNRLKAFEKYFKKYKTS